MRVLPVLIASVALTAAACSTNGESRPSGTSEPPSGSDAGTGTDEKRVGSTDDGDDERSGGGAGPFPRALAPFSDCSALLDHIRAEAGARVGPYGLGNDPWIHWFEDGDVMEMATEDSAGGDAAMPASGGDDSGDGGESGGAFTSTNVQELGVDEPDIVKTDGRRILTVTENRLSYIDVADDPVLTDTITIPEGWGHELFIRGDRALLFTNGGQWGYPMPLGTPVVDTTDAEAEFADEMSGEILLPERYGPATLIIDVDLSDPDDLRIASTMRIEGQYLSARAIDDHVRLAISSAPTQLPWLYPQNQNGEERAEQANREVVEQSTLDDWLPSYELTAGDDVTTGNLLSCDRAHRPADFSGFDMVSIVDLDLATGLGGTADGIEAVGVLASGQTVYSSMDRMYVATTKWAGADVIADEAVVREWNDEYETDLHAFAVAAGEPTRYVASGTIEGSLLNQFSLDEHDGYLRAITTDGSPWSREGESETHLVVFQEQGDRLVAVGEVGGLGRGEQLYSARLMGDIGFAVTFRQIDPFYVLDLSDPTDPRMTGELKIPGFSTYLHPVGDDLVLGIGQAATEEGRTTGLKLSLFDVSDVTDPREIAVWTEPDSNSPAEWDHRAFQMLGSTAIVPVQSWNGDFNGAVLFDIGDSITELGRVSHVRPDAVPTSDCREIVAADLTPESSELYWMVQEGYGHVQLCEPGEAGGWGDWYCDRIPVDEIRHWFNDPEAADGDLAAIGAANDDVIEMCWPDGGHRQAIQRSFVIDDLLWTVSPGAAQANTLDGLEPVANVPLG